MPRLSYEHCPSDLPFTGETIGECLERVTRTHAENEAIVSRHQNARFSYREFNDLVNRVARSLLALGVSKGDRVAVWATNSCEWVAAQFGTAKIGAVLVTVNPAYRVTELEYVLRDSRAKVLMLAESFKSSDYVEMTYEVVPELRFAQPASLTSDRLPDLKAVVLLGDSPHAGILDHATFLELGEGLPAGVVAEQAAALEIDDEINIQYPSGTTGCPKGVVLTHHNILNNANLVAHTMKVTPTDRLCIPVPFYHCFGMVLSSLLMVSQGGTMVLPAPSFDPEATLEAIEAERCTVLHGVPTMFIAQLDHLRFAAFDLRSLRTGIMAGAPCPIEVMKQVIERMHMSEVLIGYGQTEASPLCTMTLPDDPLERRVSTIGRVLPHQELKVTDPNTGRILARGAQGELCVRGYQVMARYDNQPEATATAIDNRGWLHTGDLGVMDEDGYLNITGRIKDLVIRGGENVYPREIEEFLHTLPAIADAYVVGVPDLKFGEELLAAVKLRQGAATPTPEEFRAMCKGKIAHYKIPRYWLVVDEFPMTVTGKVQKYKIREIGIEELGLEEAAKVETA
jgi:fatty-acyl-CoA synthase